MQAVLTPYSDIQRQLGSVGRLKKEGSCWILGMLTEPHSQCLEFFQVSIEENNVAKQWFPVVPENYLSNDLLLGCDVFGQAPLI